MTALTHVIRRALPAAVIALGFALSFSSGAQDDQGNDNGNGNNGNGKGNGNNYLQHNLVSDQAGVADHQDMNLRNAWGVFFNPNGPVWVANNASGTSTLYDGKGNPFVPPGAAVPLVVTIPSVDGSGTGVPTGLTFNSGGDFLIPGASPAPARFIFVTEDGVIAAWAGGTAAVKVYPSGTVNPTGAVYKGVALAGNGTAHFLYAADFHNKKIEVFDTSFMPVTSFGGFTDPGIPPEYGPFNIMNINGTLYVAYAVKETSGDDEVGGQGLGFIDAYDPNGVLLGRVASHGTLNAPWGMAIAPDGFGKFSNALIVGNFGDGTIQAYDLVKGTPLGQLRDTSNNVIVIDGLWGIQFGNGVLDQPTTTLFFAAGPNGETDGLYGTLTATNPVQKPGGGHGHGH
jgi:uncharacterized protein (TIGR03118 family)